MRKIILLIGLGVLMSLNASSLLPKFYEKTLDNGLKIVVIPMQNGTDVIETNIYYKVGSRDEFMGKSGIAHMLEHLNFKSTKNLKAGEFDKVVKGFGGLTNASTGFDYTNYYVSSTAKNLDKTLSLYAEIMQNLKLNNKEFLPERQVVAEERRWRTDNSPIGYLYFNFFNTAFIYHSYHWTPIGFMDDILNWKIDDIRAFHKTYYQPQNAVVLIAGDIAKDDAFSLVEKHFSKLKNTTKSIPAVYTKEPVQKGAKVVELLYPTEVEWLALGYKIPNFEDKDIPALKALGSILASGKSSILERRLVDEKKLSTEVYAENMALKDYGVFLFLVNANSSTTAKAIKAEILEILKEIKAGNISKEDLDKVKINTKSSFINGLDNASSVASLFGKYFALGSIKPLLDYENAINSLKIEDIVRVANKYLIEETSTTVILKKGK